VIVYFNGQYLEKSAVRISPDDRGFLFADGLYDVVRSYRGHLFRCSDHLERLAFGLGELRIQDFDPSAIEDIAPRLLEANGMSNAEAAIYMQVTRGVAPRSHKFPPAGTPPTVYVEAKPFSPPFAIRQAGANAMIIADQRWQRCDLKTTGLLANILAHQQAVDAGAFEAIFSRDGILLEGSHSSMVFVKDGVLTCPQLNQHILPGVTRKVVLSLAAAASIPNECRPCLEKELPDFEEVLMLGTTVEIVPIVAVNGRRIGTGEPGPIARRLQQAFGEVVKSLSVEAKLPA